MGGNVLPKTGGELSRGEVSGGNCPTPIKRRLYFTWDAIIRVTRDQPQSNASVRLSLLGCLSSLVCFACSPSVSFSSITLCVLSCAAPQLVFRRYDRDSMGTRSQFYDPGNSTATGTRVTIDTN